MRYSINFPAGLSAVIINSELFEKYLHAVPPAADTAQSVIWVLKVRQGEQVPSLDRFRDVLEKMAGDPTLRCLPSRPCAHFDLGPCSGKAVFLQSAYHVLHGRVSNSSSGARQSEAAGAAWTVTILGRVGSHRPVGARSSALCIF